MSLNRVTLVGRLVRDPEMKYTPSGMAITTITLAVDKRMSKEQKEKAQAAGQPTADFPRIIAFGKTAETMGNFLEKGKMISVDGRLQTSTFKDQQGNTRYSTDVIADFFDFINDGGKKSGGDVNVSEKHQDDFAAIEDDEEMPF